MEIVNNRIVLDKELSVLDKFVLDFVKNISLKYVIVSGYVSIIFGRSRGSEDIDMIIEVLSEVDFNLFFEDVSKSGFECINESANTAYGAIKQGVSLRFAKAKSVIPNMEVKFAESFASLAALKNRIEVSLQGETVFISPIELQIVYKKRCLGSEKDLEDAKHLEVVFKDSISMENINKYDFLLSQHGC